MAIFVCRSQFSTLGHSHLVGIYLTSWTLVYSSLHLIKIFFFSAMHPCSFEKHCTFPFSFFFYQMLTFYNLQNLGKTERKSSIVKIFFSCSCGKKVIETWAKTITTLTVNYTFCWSRTPLLKLSFVLL